MPKTLEEYTKDELIDIIKNLKRRKKFGLVWEDKPEEVVRQVETELPVLEEVAKRAIEKVKDAPTNFIIEGDNYHSLSALNYTHTGRVDVIYIDPPYNTGNKDFIYNDRYVDREDTFKHSKWLSFMSKRLMLAHSLLNNNGIIFISIGEDEYAELKILCDQIFGRENFVANLVWENREGGGSSDSKFFKIKHEYILTFAKNKKYLTIRGEVKEEDKAYAYKDKYQKERGRYKLIKLNSFSIQYSASLDYEIELPDGTKITPHENGKRGCWRWSKKKFQWGLENDFIEFRKNADGKLWVYTKQYFKVDHNGNAIVREAPFSGVIDKWSSTLATKQLEKVFQKKVFSYPKPTELIKFLVSLKPEDNVTVLDFFAGSGTAGHAVLQLNQEDGGNRNFILCTDNENGIAESITYERINKAIAGYGDTHGIPANLRYFKTSLVSKQQTDDQTRIELVARSTDMICLREDAFEKVIDTKLFKVFGNADHYAAIVFEPEAIVLLKDALAKLKDDKPIHIYVFSLSNDTYESDFTDLEREHELRPIPESILEVYRRIHKQQYSELGA